MDEVAVLEVGRDALFVILKASAPVMVIGMIVGLAVSILQALTSIQEMTLAFVPKIVVIFISILIFLPFMMTTVIEFAQRLFDRMIAVG